MHLKQLMSPHFWKHHCWTIFLKILAYVLNGLAIKFLWQWSVVEIFHIHDVGFIEATLLGVFINLTANSKYTPRNREERLNHILYTIYTPAIALGTGLVLHVILLLKT
jgi:hypothetical protein